VESSGRIELRVAGKSEGKQRPRFNPFTKRVYTPPANTISENDVRSVWREVGSPRIEGKPPIGIEITITVMRPQSHFKKSGDLSAEGQRMILPSNKKPDVDNAIKLVMDALNTRAYKDDVQVCRAYVNRVWGEWPETHISIYELDAESRPKL
jgi:Holliday junction resolvase RusA-like endonuclease